MTLLPPSPSSTSFSVAQVSTLRFLQKELGNSFEETATQDAFSQAGSDSIVCVLPDIWKLGTTHWSERKDTSVCVCMCVYVHVHTCAHTKLLS